jgi:microsomal epoxide hydrolase
MRVTRFALISVFVCSSLAQGLAGQAKSSIQIRKNVATLKDGVQIHYLEAGQASAQPALVFITGWTMPAFLWNEQLQRFSADRLVIAADPRSQGDSTKTSSGNTPEQRARDLHEILGQKNVKSAVLIGWSQGAQDVAAYVQQFGTASVAGVVFVDAPVSAGPAEIDLNKQYSQRTLGLLSIYATSPRDYAAGMVQAIFKKHPELDQKAIIEHSLKTPVDTGIAMLVMDIFAVDRRPALSKIDRPTLVIASAESPLLDAQKKMADTVPGAQFVAVDGAGHAVFVDQPKIFGDALQRFVDGIKRP